MKKEELVRDLMHFLSEDPACKKTLACLNSKAEISIRIAHCVQVCVKHDGDKVVAEECDALAPDFIFDTDPETLAALIAEPNLSPAQLGLKFVKYVMSRDIKISMPSSFLQVTRKGYLKIISLGGREFLQGLSEHNLASLPKIMAAVKNLRK
jgi:hypothetical protein